MELFVKEFIQVRTATITIYTAKQYCKYYCVTVLKVKNAGETTDKWDLAQGDKCNSKAPQNVGI